MSTIRSYLYLTPLLNAPILYGYERIYMLIVFLVDKSK